MSNQMPELGRFAEPSLYILVSLSDGPKHGYAIMADVEMAVVLHLERSRRQGRTQRRLDVGGGDAQPGLVSAGIYVMERAVLGRPDHEAALEAILSAELATRQAMHAECPQSIGQLSAFGGNAGVLIRAYVYARLLGREGMRRVGEFATLNANYLAARLRDKGFDLAYPKRRASHEFIVTVQRQKKENGITALDFSKSLLDYGIHAPTNYFPLLVPECLLIEPTETESKDVLDEFVEVMGELLQKSRSEPEWMKGAPYTTPVRRLDDVKAARDLDLGYVPPKASTSDLNAGEPAHI